MEIRNRGSPIFLALQTLDRERYKAINRCSRRDPPVKSAPNKRHRFEGFFANRIIVLTPWLNALTEFGDVAVLMPLAAAMLVWLLLMRSPRGAIWWAIAVALCSGLTAILKVSFYGCPPTPDLRSPSGHTSFSTLVYGAMTLVSATESAGLRRILTVSGSAGFILAIVASRLTPHSGPEVGLGLVIGISSLTLFGQGYLRCRAPRVSLSPLLFVGGVVLLALHGRELDAEHFLHAIAGYLRIHCP